MNIGCAWCCHPGSGAREGGYPFTVKGCRARWGCMGRIGNLFSLVTNRKYICFSIHFVHYDAN